MLDQPSSWAANSTLPLSEQYGLQHFHLFVRQRFSLTGAPPKKVHYVVVALFNTVVSESLRSSTRVDEYGGHRATQGCPEDAHTFLLSCCSQDLLSKCSPHSGKELCCLPAETSVSTVALVGLSAAGSRYGRFGGVALLQVTQSCVARQNLSFIIERETPLLRCTLQAPHPACSTREHCWIIRPLKFDRVRTFHGREHRHF